jgi:zinc protease
MKIKITLLLTLLFCTGLMNAGQNAVDQKKGILPYPIHQKKLPNGLNVVTVPYDSPGIAAFYIVVRVGSRDEIEAGKTGFAHFFEHMMFRGTEKYPKDKYSDELKAIGASANANTSLDRTVYHMTGNALMLEKMFELEADRFMKLKYSVGDFKTEAGAVKGEYTKNYSNPFTKLNEMMNDAAFSNHTYKHTTMGFFEDVVAMPDQYEYSLQFFDRFYRPEYTTIIVVGDATPEKVNALAEKYFGEWKTGSHKTVVPVEPKQTETKYTHLKNASFPPVITLNYKGPAFNVANGESMMIDVLNSVLFSEKSDLYKKLVIEEQKVRSLFGQMSDTRDPHLISIGAVLVKADDMEYVKNEIKKAIEKAKTVPVDAKTLDETKSRIRYSFAMSMDNPSSIANSLSAYIWLTGDPDALNTTYARYEKVTANDLMTVAKKFFTPENVTVATISGAETSPVKY